jgi:hypothetical protein
LAQNLSIESEPDGIRLNLDDVPVEQAVEALSERFDFTLKIVRPSGARLSGSRSGDALELLNWVLNGHDRAIFMSDTAGEERIARVVIFGPSGGAPPAAPQPMSPESDPVYNEDGAIDDIPPELNEPGQPPMDGGISDYSGEQPMDPDAQ